MRSGYLILFSFLLIFFSCSKPKEGKETLVGSWKARWSAAETFDLSALPRVKAEMDGKMSFGADGTMTIVGYGYPGCLFHEDTIENTLEWKIEGEQIILRNKEENFDLQYEIIEIGENGAKFRFLDDFIIDLRKE